MIRPRILVVGAGVSGLSAAREAATRGATVDLLSLHPAARAHSACEADGINAASESMDAGDSPRRHFEETVSAGGFLASQPAALSMCRAAERIVGLLHRMGVPFDRTCEGRLERRRLPGSSCRRALGVADITGRAVLAALDSQARRLEEEGRLIRHEGVEMLSAILDEGGLCRGVVAMDLRSMEVSSWPADATILCSGGYGAIFSRSTASLTCTGSAIVSVYQQGADICNPEFLALHPAVKGPDKWLPLPEALRPEDRWPSMMRRADPEQHLRVEPAVAGTLGGLWVDDRHMTRIPGLLAAGECAAIYHGASRLAGNLLLSCIHGGQVAGAAAVEHAEGREHSDPPASLLESNVSRESAINAAISRRDGKESLDDVGRELRETMDENVAMARENDGLGRAVAALDTLAERLSRARLSDGSPFANASLPLARRLHSMLVLARVTALAALARDESRGSHRKPQFPERDDANFLCVTRARHTPSGPELRHDSVDVTILPPQEDAGA